MPTSLTEITDSLAQRTGSVFWVNREHQDAFNESLCMWQALTGEFILSFPVLITSQTTFLTVPKQLISPQRVKYTTPAGVETVLTQQTIYELDYGTANWENAAAGTPTDWAPIGMEEIALSPPPSSGIVTIEGMSDAPVLLTPGDTLNARIDTDLLTRLKGYAHHYLTLKEAGTEFGATLSFLRELIQSAASRNAELLQHAAFRKYLGLSRDDAVGLNPQEAQQEEVGSRG